MASLYNQPLAHRFGVSLQDELAESKWTSLHVAVAWARRTGTSRMLPALKRFVSSGRAARFIVGIDVENTSYEGLEDLLSLGAVGSVEIFIYHNEAGGLVFHPKLYLFLGPDEGKLIVGSNNLTGAGLYTNTEAGLEIEAAVGDPVILQAQAALASWCDLDDGFAKRLDDSFLRDLETEGYVARESVLRSRRAASSTRVRATGRRPLFRGLAITLPAVPGGTPGLGGVAQGINAAPGTVLLMRVRRASENARRTQVQLPIAVVDTAFFNGITSVRSAHDREEHRISTARARGTVNTLKLEIPEINLMRDPVLRLERTATGVEYRAFDATATLGKPIMDALRRGLSMRPQSTRLTVPSNPASSTWWRFI